MSDEEEDQEEEEEEEEPKIQQPTIHGLSSEITGVCYKAKSIMNRMISNNYAPPPPPSYEYARRYYHIPQEQEQYYYRQPITNYKQDQDYQDYLEFMRFKQFKDSNKANFQGLNSNKVIDNYYKTLSDNRQNYKNASYLYRRNQDQGDQSFKNSTRYGYY